MFGLSLKWCEYYRPFEKHYFWHDSLWKFDSFEEAQDYALELVDCGLKKLNNYKRRSKYPFHRVVEYKVYPMEIDYDD